MTSHMLSGLLLGQSTSAVDVTKCIICQAVKRKTISTSQEHGRKRLREAAAIRNDEVNKRLKTLADDAEICYHNDNMCYKKYTKADALQKIMDDNEQQATCSVNDPQLDVTQAPVTLRSSTVPRSAPSTDVDSDQLPCTVCGSDRIQTQCVRIRTKFRLSEEKRAQAFLDATNYFNDDVRLKVADLETVSDVFAADIYCHDMCLTKYIVSHQRALSAAEKSDDHAATSRKRLLFQKAADNIDSLIADGYALSVTDIREFVMSMDETEIIQLYNNEVKQFMIERYGEKIKFTKSNRANQSQLVYSADITEDALATKLRNLDVVRSAGELLGQVLRGVDFQLEDKFCDGSELMESWEKTTMPESFLTFFASLFGIKKSRMLNIEMLQMSGDDEDDNADESDDDSSSEQIEWAVKNQHCQLFCLFQIMFYQKHHGAKKTPLHVMLAQHQYAKGRSRELLTSTNRIGVTTSYTDVRRSRRLLAAYAIESSTENGTPIPSTFRKDSFTIAAIDNADFADKSSLSGKESSHDTVTVLFQEALTAPNSKPSVSSTGLSKSTCFIHVLPCQQVPIHPKPVVRPSLPHNFKSIEDTNLSVCHSVLDEARTTEQLISLIRVGLPDAPHVGLPPWGGIHALISAANVPLMRVGFLPVIPAPVTDYATVRKALVNLQSVRMQLSQTMMPVFCDEGVFHTVADILMSEPDTFEDIYGMLGGFHYAKVLLRCIGRYISGSGMDDALIEAEVFGKRTLVSVLTGSHYYRSMQGMLMIAEVIDSLSWEAFFLANDTQLDDDLMQLHVLLGEKNAEVARTKFPQVLALVQPLLLKYNTFLAECQARSEMAAFNLNIKKMVDLVKCLTTADREGLWPLHVSCVQSSMAIFQEFDAVNYLRYGSYYLEKIKVLEVEHPELYRRFMISEFVVRDHAGSFNSVAPDMKLEQSIQRASKSQGGIVGQTRNSAVVVEWELIFHEILLIQNNFRELTNERVMDHHETCVHHELKGNKGVIFDTNVSSLLDFVRARENPFIITTPCVKLHNFVTEQVVNDEIKHRLLKVFENGEKVYNQYRQERFVLKTKKLAVTIPKRNLPKFDTVVGTKPSTTSHTTTPKVFAAAQRDIEIARERGMTLEDVFTHDHLPTSPLFDGEFTSATPDKSKLMTQLETYLTGDVGERVGDLSDGGLKTVTLLDFMSKVRQYPNLSYFGNFGGVVKKVMSTGLAVSPSCEALHVICDSYIDESLKGGERIRRAGNVGSVELAVLDESTPIPQQMEKFWVSSENKSKLLQLVRTVVAAGTYSVPVVLSGMVVNQEQVPALIHSTEKTEPTVIPELTGWLEEADDRIVPHAIWAVQHGCQCLIVVSNDTDTVTRLLRFTHMLVRDGLKELFVEFGTGEKRRLLPLHHMAERMGEPLCRVVVKAHVLTGDDVTSRIGTKLAAMQCNPIEYLTEFAERAELQENEIAPVEEYLVRVWAGARSKPSAKTFDKLRLDVHINASAATAMSNMPPTSSVVRGHITRAFFVIRGIVDREESRLDCCQYGWESDGVTLTPSKCMNPLPLNMLSTCKCSGMCDTMRCPCRKSGVKCVIYCHKSQGGNCQNHG